MTSKRLSMSDLRNGRLLDKTPSSVKNQRALFHVKQARHFEVRRARR
jgi:hypothetical protein